MISVLKIKHQMRNCVEKKDIHTIRFVNLNRRARSEFTKTVLFCLFYIFECVFFLQNNLCLPRNTLAREKKNVKFHTC